MSFLIVLLLVMVGLWLYGDFQRKREQRDSVTVVPAPNRPRPPRHQRVSETELKDRAHSLRSAVDAGAVTLEEAIESLSRTCGISKDAARDRLS